MASIDHIYTSFPRIQWDGVSDVSHLAFSYMLSLLLPQRHLSSRRINKIKREQVMSQLEQKFNTSNFNVFFSGLLREVLAYPDMWPLSDLQMGSASCKVRPSDLSVLLHPNGVVVSGRQSASDGNVTVFALDQEVLPGNLRLYVDDAETVLPAGIQCIRKTGNRQYLMSREFHETCVKSTSRVNRVCRLDLEETKLPGGTEFRFGLRCNVWPRAVTAAWEKRAIDRGWPSEETINKITSGSCHVVPCASETWRLLDEATEWRYAFGGSDVVTIGDGAEWKFRLSLGEATLAASLSNVQRQAFMIFRILVKHTLGPPYRIITLRHLKALFYRVCEKLTAKEWQQEDVLGYAVLTLLDDLFSALINNEIFDYFRPDVNLLGDIDDGFFVALRRQLSEIRDIPVDKLLDIFQSNKFQFTPLNKTIREALEGICKVHDTWLDDELEILDGMTENMLELTSIYFNQGWVQEGLDTCTEYCKLYKQLKNENFTLATYLASFGMSFPRETQLQMYKCFLDKYDIRDAETPNVIRNMMQIKYDVINQETNAKQKARRIDDTDADYRKIIARPGLDESIKGNYALFLWVFRDANAAIPVLESLVKNQSKNNIHLKMEVEILHKTIQSEIGTVADIEGFPSFLLIYYFLVKCYAETNAKVSDNFMSTFENRVFEMESKEPDAKEKNARCFLLLSYAYKTLELFDKALNCCELALKIKPDYSPAKTCSDEIYWLQQPTNLTPQTILEPA